MGVLLFQFFPFVFLIIIGFFVYHLRKSQRFLSQNRKNRKFRKGVKDEELIKTSFKDSFRILPIITTFFGFIFIIPIFFIVCLLVFGQVWLVTLLTFLGMVLILYFVSIKIKSLRNKSLNS